VRHVTGPRAPDGEQRQHQRQRHALTDLDADVEADDVGDEAVGGKREGLPVRVKTTAPFRSAFECRCTISHDAPARGRRLREGDSVLHSLGPVDLAGQSLSPAAAVRPAMFRSVSGWGIG